MLRSLLIVLLLGYGSSALASDLLRVYQEALDNDPQLRAASSAYKAALTAKPQARALLLPNANFSADTSRNSYDTSTTSKNEYNSHGYGISLKQPVFRYNYWIQLQQSDYSIQKAEADFSAAQQDLILRTAETYFAVLAAEDSLEFARAEKTAIGRQLEQAQKRFDVGLIAITDVHEAQSAYDLSVANEIAADNQLATAHEALTEITGIPNPVLATLGTELPLLEPQPANMQEWTSTALKQNLQLQSAIKSADIAQENIRLQRSGHLPTLDLVAGYNKANKANIGGGIAKDTTSSSISLELNIPIYEGGLVTQKTREAVYLHNQSLDILEQQRRLVLHQARDAYRGVISGISRVKALLAATISTRSALETTEAGFEVGTRTIVDVLNAQRDVFRAKRDYAQARYDYILNTLRLKQAAGTLQPEDLKYANQWLR